MRPNQRTARTVLVAGILAAAACSSSTSWKPNPGNTTSLDGPAATTDSNLTDTPTIPQGTGGSGGGKEAGNAGGTYGSGGVIGYDAGSRGSSGGAPVVDASAGGKDVAVASGGSGGAPSTVGSGGGSGSGGIAMTGGTATAKGGAPGAGGASSTRDASITPVPADAGGDPPICPFDVVRGDYLISCKDQGLTVCRDRKSPNVCVCDSTGKKMTCSGGCPPSAPPGNLCMGETYSAAACFWENTGLCECVKDTLRYSCARQLKPDAATDKGPDTPPWYPDKMVLCSSDPTFGSCESVDSGTVVSCGNCKVPSDAGNYDCLMNDKNGVCRCLNGFWNCPAAPCPAVVESRAECDPAARYCSASHTAEGWSEICGCVSNISDADPGYHFTCWSAN